MVFGDILAAALIPCLCVSALAIGAVFVMLALSRSEPDETHVKEVYHGMFVVRYHTPVEMRVYDAAMVVLWGWCRLS